MSLEHFDDDCHDQEIEKDHVATNLRASGHVSNSPAQDDIPSEPSSPSNSSRSEIVSTSPETTQHAEQSRHSTSNFSQTRRPKRVRTKPTRL